MSDKKANQKHIDALNSGEDIELSPKTAKQMEKSGLKMAKDLKSKEYARLVAEKTIFKVVSLKDGRLVKFEKPKLQTTFCFPYDEYLQGSIENTNRACEAVRSDYEVFLQQNLRHIESKIEDLEKVLKHYEDENEFAWVGQANNKEVSFVVVGPEKEIKEYYKHGMIKLNKEDTESILNVWKEMLGYLKKRCAAYWKRYGGSKVRTWTYSVWNED